MRLFMLVLFLLVSTAALAQPELTADYDNPDSHLTFSYPEGWVTSDTDVSPTSAYLANSEEAIALNIDTVHESGAVSLRVGAWTISEIVEEQRLDVEPGDSAADVMQAFIMIVESLAIPFELGEPETLTIDDREAVRIDMGSEGIFSGSYWIIELHPDVFGTLRLTTAPGEAAEWDETAQAILETIAYLEPETAVITSQNGKVTFRYPAGWETRIQSGSVVVANTTAALEDALGNEIVEGNVSILVSVYSTGDTDPFTSALGVVTQFQREDRGIWDISDVASTIINGVEAAHYRVTDGRFTFQAWHFEVQPGVLGYVSLLTHPDEADRWLPTLFEIADSISYKE